MQIPHLGPAYSAYGISEAQHAIVHVRGSHALRFAFHPFRFLGIPARGKTSGNTRNDVFKTIFKNVFNPIFTPVFWAIFKSVFRAS